jgi:hypothetical protein
MTINRGRRQHRLDEDVDRAAARAAAGMHLDALGRPIAIRVGLRPDADQARLAIGQRPARRLLDGGSRAATADPANHGAVASD